MTGAKLDLSGASAVEPIVIKVVSLNGMTTGAFTGYDVGQGRTWVIADYSDGNATGGVIVFSADKFTIDTSGFANDPNSTRFSISTDANSNRLVLTFTPVPESVFPLAVVAAVVGVWAFVRRLTSGKA